MVEILKFAREYKITKLVYKKDLISLLNCLLGLYSIYFAFKGNLRYSALFMIFAVVADIMDGEVARKLSRPTDFGKRMDIADLISFGAAPSIFILAWLDTSLWVHIAALSLTSAVILRLARFQSNESDVEGFVGVPSTTNGILFPLLYFLELNWIPVVLITFAMSFLMLSSVIIPIKSGY